MSDKKDIIQISHVALACFLWYQGHEVVDKHWVAGICSWDFAYTDELKEDRSTFFQGRSRVDARDYFHRVTEFKQNMYKDKPE